MSAAASGAGARWLRRAAMLLALTVSGVMAGCATASRPDPLERVNRAVFGFNEALDQAVVKPVATVYRDTLPPPVRQGVTNFFWNFSDAWSAVNLTLQGRLGDAASNAARFGANTVFGVFGLFDVATPLGLERYDEDLGQTLGVWGVPTGAYIVLPLLGPSSLRDMLNVPFDQKFNPAQVVSSSSLSTGLSLTQVINLRAGLLQATRMIDEVALDKYVFVRDVYLQRRRNLVYNGNPPDLPIPPEDDLPDPTLPPASTPGGP